MALIRSTSTGQLIHDRAFTPQRVNISFGRWRKDGAVLPHGAAAAGDAQDLWNAVGMPWQKDHIAEGLVDARGEPTPVRARLVNLGGGWAFSGQLALSRACPMIDSFNYPQNNQGGLAEVVLVDVPAGGYELLVYGVGTEEAFCGDYGVFVGDRFVGRKQTSAERGAHANTWVEGGQYVRFPVRVGEGEAIDIVIRPGGVMREGRVADAFIAGLQLVPTSTVIMDAQVLS
jgi:hypothetical protein